jgi:hypothetical protein
VACYGDEPRSVSQWRWLKVAALAPVCGTCFASGHARIGAADHGHEWQWTSPGRGWYDEPSPCDGCGRPVVYGRDSRWCRRLYCSERCERRAEYRASRPGADRKTACASCGVEFAPKRSDSRYCSPACRQKSYRTRQSTGRSSGTEGPFAG